MEGFCGCNMAAQPGKSSPRRKSSKNDEKKPGYPLQRQGCVFESLSPKQLDPVLLPYCTVNVEKPNTNYLKKLKKVDLLYALFDVTDQSESLIRSKRYKIYFCLIPSLKCVRNRVPKQQMLMRYCTNYIIIVVLYIYSTRILRIILYYIAIEGSGASISLMSNNAQPITLLF